MRPPFQCTASHLISRIKRRLLVKGVSRGAATDFSLAVPFGYLAEPATLDRPIAVICHIFHGDLATTMCRKLTNIPFRCDLFISTDTEAKCGFIENVFAAWTNGRVEIRVAPNRGRDIAPKFVTFRDVYDDYDLLLFLHTKKSIQMENGAGWREMLMQSLLGSPEIVCSVVDVFRRFPSMGMVIPQHYEPMRKWVGWGENYRQARRLAGRMGLALKPDQFIDFASGSMFWARSAALRPILDLRLRYEDFPPETGQIDGTTAHVMERLLLYSCEQAGFTWIKVAEPSHFEDPTTIVPIQSPADLDIFMNTHCFRLTPSEALRR
jgi:lipopolysaccharide biosynthesis protein